MKVETSRGPYQIRFLSGESLFEGLPGSAFWLTDELVAKLHAGRLRDRKAFIVPQGESSKSIEWFSRALEWLAESGAKRSSTLIAFGGGVIGDLAGFVAASYMRGIPFVQIPTTLLAQVDSSVGGKVGIDLAAGKNLAGAFWPPAEVRIGVELLETLPDRQWRNGYAEAIKYGFIEDPSLVELFEGGLPQGDRIAECVRRSIEIKAKVVAEDEFETTGRRAILNFGHTIGHAIEKISGYGPILHGEAITVGMILEARLGERLGLTEKGTANRVEELLQPLLPLTSQSWRLASSEEFVSAMRKDKKVKDQGLAFSLLTKLGHCKLVTNVPEDAVVRILEEA